MIASCALRWMAGVAILTTVILLEPSAPSARGPRPPLPSSLSSALVGGRVVVRYCFARLSVDPVVRPALIFVGLDNPSDNLPTFTLRWPIKKRCGVVRHPVAPIKPPYRLLIAVGAAPGGISPTLEMRVGQTR
jgi:hypothetical protein